MEATHRLGAFIGVRIDGQLVAMSGERMRAPALTEVSAVCTHPDWRGRGLAGKLMRVVMDRIVARVEADPSYRTGIDATHESAQSTTADAVCTSMRQVAALLAPAASFAQEAPSAIPAMVAQLKLTPAQR